VQQDKVNFLIMFNELLRYTAVLTVVMGLFSARFAVVSLRRRTN